MNVKLDLLVPQWLLEYDTWKQFLEVLEESLTEISGEMDELRMLYDLSNEEVQNEFVRWLADSFGFGVLERVDLERNVKLLDNQRGFVERKASVEFFGRLWELLSLSVSMEDLSEKVMVLSGARNLSDAKLQDGMFYRDGSIQVIVPLSQFWDLKELEEFVHVGVMVWYSVLSGIWKAEFWSRIYCDIRNEGFTDKFVELANPVICFQNQEGREIEELGRCDARCSSYFFVENTRVAVLRESCILNADVVILA